MQITTLNDIANALFIAGLRTEYEALRAYIEERDELIMKHKILTDGLLEIKALVLSQALADSRAKLAAISSTVYDTCTSQQPA